MLKMTRRNFRRIPNVTESTDFKLDKQRPQEESKMTSTGTSAQREPNMERDIYKTHNLRSTVAAVYYPVKHRETRKSYRPTDTSRRPPN